MKRALSLLAALLVGAAALAAPTSPGLWRDLVRSYDKGVRENDSAARQSAENGLRKLREVQRESDGVSIRTETPLPEPPVTREVKLFGAQLKELAETRAVPGKTDPASQAREILSGQEFIDAASGRSQKTALERWLESTFKKIGEWLEKLHLKPPSGGGNPDAIVAFAETVRYVLYFLIGVGVLVLGYYLVRHANDSGWMKRKKKKSESATEDPLLDIDIADPVSDAEIAELAGEWRQAARLYYISALRQLRERGWLVMEANRTNWEYQRLLHQRNQALARLLLPATRRFDYLWYGKRVATQEDVRQMRASAASIKEAIQAQDKAE